MAAPHNPLPDVNDLDVEALRALALEQHAQLVSRDIEIDNLKLLVLKLKRMQFGRKSEKLDRQIGQLELRLEDLEWAPAAQPEPSVSAAVETVPNKPARRPLPEALPRITKTHAPKRETCPDCGGSLRRLGEDVSEMLEYVPGHFEVIRIVRPKLSCAAAVPGSGPEVKIGGCRGKTVTKPGLLSPLGLALSEKQIPQVVEKLESGINEKKLWKAPSCAQGRRATKLRYAPRARSPLKWLCIQSAFGSQTLRASQFRPCWLLAIVRSSQTRAPTQLATHSRLFGA